jgi:hypothetical protein
MRVCTNANAVLTGLQAYQFSDNKNSEIALRWQQLCLASGYAAIIPHVVTFITSQVCSWLMCA